MRCSLLILGSLCLIAGADNVWGPPSVTIHHGDTLYVTCDYNQGFEHYVKYWCRGAARKSCAVIIKSEGSHGRYSISDSPSSRSFLVIGRRMRPEDSDTYYCGMERTFGDDMHPIKVTVLPGLCKKTPLWASMVDFPPGFVSVSEGRAVEVSCKEQYEERTFRLTCEMTSGGFRLYPNPETAPCTRKCQRMGHWGQNISMYPVKEYYGPDEEVTLSCPEEYRPNYSKIQCMRINGTNAWNETDVFCSITCQRMGHWGQNISMYPVKEYYGPDEEVTLSCPEEYRPNYSKIQCMRVNGTNAWNETDVFCIYAPVTCQRMGHWGQNISMYPVKESYGADEEVTLSCPDEYRPNYSKIQCMRINGTNAWNETDVFCIYAPGAPGVSSPSWRSIAVSCFFGLIPPMAVKLVTILVILIVRVIVQRRSPSSLDKESCDSEADMTEMNSKHRPMSNLYHKGREAPKIPEDAENDPEVIYANTSCDVYINTP